jgi:hypothetical protein
MDSSLNNRLLNNNGGIYNVDYGKNNLLLTTGYDATIPSTNWSTFTDLAISGWFKASALADGDKLLEFVASVEETQEYPPASLNNAGTATDVSLTLSGQLYGNGTYRMIVSSAYSVGYAVKNVFNKQSPNEEFWGSSGSTGFLYNTTTGVYYGNTSTTYNTSLTYSGEWCQIQFPNQILLKSYSLVGQVNTTLSAIQSRSPKNFIILGSNNGTSWFLLDTQTNITGWGNTGTVKTFNLTNNNTQYSYYRICCNSTQGGQYSEILAISEWKLFNYVPPINILIKKVSTNLSFQINNIPVYQTPSFANNTWTHILWNIANSSANGFVRLSTTPVGTENLYTKVLPTSGSYTNRLGSITNVSSVNISDFRIITEPLTTEIKNRLYSSEPTYSSFVDTGYVANVVKNMDSLYYNSTKEVEANANGITVYGNMTATNDIVPSYSDMRLKQIVSYIDNPLDKIMQIQTFKYLPSELARTLNINDNKVRIGLSAQDVQKVLPEIVCLAPFDTSNLESGDIVSVSSSNYLSVSYERVVPLLVECLKELKRELNLYKQ